MRLLLEKIVIAIGGSRSKNQDLQIIKIKSNCAVFMIGFNKPEGIKEIIHFIIFKVKPKCIFAKNFRAHYNNRMSQLYTAFQDNADY